MATSSIERLAIFVIVFVIFLPYTSKVVRLASRTWDNRSDLSPERVRQILLVTPLLLVVSFILVYALVVFLIDTLVFS